MTVCLDNIQETVDLYALEGNLYVYVTLYGVSGNLSKQIVGFTELI